MFFCYEIIPFQYNRPEFFEYAEDLEPSEETAQKASKDVASETSTETVDNTSQVQVRAQ